MSVYRQQEQKNPETEWGHKETLTNQLQELLINSVLSRIFNLFVISRVLQPISIYAQTTLCSDFKLDSHMCVYIDCLLFFYEHDQSASLILLSRWHVTCFQQNSTKTPTQFYLLMVYFANHHHTCFYYSNTNTLFQQNHLGIYLNKIYFSCMLKTQTSETKLQLHLFSLSFLVNMTLHSQASLNLRLSVYLTVLVVHDAGPLLHFGQSASWHCSGTSVTELWRKFDIVYSASSLIWLRRYHIWDDLIRGL